ncbi:MAG: zinc-binding dehydrogenase, partial [Nitrososphaerales archaeon]
PVGSFAIIMAKERGARQVIAIDSSSRLEFAKKMGADDVVDLTALKDQKERVKKIRQIAGGYGPDVVMDCTGNPNALPEAVEIVRDGGRILEIGAYADYGPIPLNPYFLTSRQISIIGSYSKIPRHEYEFVNFMVKKWEKYPFQGMVTHRFPLKEINKAVDVVKNRQGMKVIVTPAGSIS